MGLRDIELTLPPGFRFYPSDEELVCHYLHNKVANQRLTGGGAMVEVDLHIHEPWELPDVAKLSTNEWYFFSFRDRKYATGLRTNRATKSGYWKATGKDRIIHNHRSISGAASGAVVGMRKTLVFYRGRAPNGIKTSWVMHEFRMENPHTPPKEDWVLCRVFYKKKVDAVDYAMDSEQEMGIARSAVASAKYSSSSPDSAGYSPSFLPPLVSGGYHHHHQLPPSSDHHHNGGDFSAAMALLQHNSIFDFHGQPHLDGDDGLAAGQAVAAAASRDGGGGDHCGSGGGGVLMDLGLDQEHFNYNSLMQM